MKEILVSLLLSVFALLSFGQDNIKPEDIQASRKIRRAQLNDPIRPGWHLAIAEGNGHPFDPNGAFFKDGLYHMFYLYQVEEGRWQWQHLSSLDLFHWRWLPDDLQPTTDSPENGISSGNAFIDKDDKVVIAYHGAGTEGTCVAKMSNDFSAFQKAEKNPIVTTGWADPHMWLEKSTYYLLMGSEQVKGDNPPLLFKGEAYDRPMEKVGVFLTHDMPDVDSFEDVSCPDFFKLGDKWVLVCISHTRGARYYIGEWDGKQFRPETHHRMNWPGGTFFAPETLLDESGRRILWAWVLDRKTGVSSGTMSMPRVLTLAEDKRSLNINPPGEVEILRYQPVTKEPFDVGAGQPVTLDQIQGKSLELDIIIDPGQARRFGLKVFCSRDGREETPIVIDRDKDILQINMEPSSLDKPEYYEFAMMHLCPYPKNPVVQTQNAPFTLKSGEKLHLRVFLDNSILEVFANGRQCITQVVYPTLEDAVHVKVFTEDAPVKTEQLKAWKLFPSMQW